MTLDGTDFIVHRDDNMRIIKENHTRESHVIDHACVPYTANGSLPGVRISLVCVHLYVTCGSANPLSRIWMEFYCDVSVSVDQFKNIR